MFTLTIETTNAAFTPEPAPELARLLRKVADDIEAGRLEGAVIDANGNRVGQWAIES